LNPHIPDADGSPTETELPQSGSLADAPRPQDEQACLIVGIDQNPATVPTLTCATALAKRLHARLEVVHVVDISDYPIDPDNPDWETAAAAALNEQRQKVTRTLASFPETWAFHVKHGTPATVLTAMANQNHALMIVLGAGRRGRAAALARMVDGSVIRALTARQCQVPVLVVPAGTPQDAP
jgi:nucleotide-binding universal stress UspA family protein